MTLITLLPFSPKLWSVEISQVRYNKNGCHFQISLGNTARRVPCHLQRNAHYHTKCFEKLFSTNKQQSLSNSVEASIFQVYLSMEYSLYGIPVNLLSCRRNTSLGNTAFLLVQSLHRFSVWFREQHAFYLLGGRFLSFLKYF